jgi:hypothetical protein
MAATASFIATPKTPVVAFVNADGTAFKTVMTAGALGSRIDSLLASNGDAAGAYVLQLAIQVSGVDYIIGEVTVPLGAGTNGSAKSVSLLNTADIPALAVAEGSALWLAAGASLRVRPKTAISGANTLQVVGLAAGDY